MEHREMRKVINEFLFDQMSKNDRIFLIDADLSIPHGTIDLRKAFPDRALDVGIAEQNMASVAAGIAAAGGTVFIESFAPFATRRACDQIAISIAHANRNVKIIGSDPGINAELNGGTHMAIEDIGVMRSIPNMMVFEAVDDVQLAKALPALTAYQGAVYIRMGRKLVMDVFDEDYEFNLFGTDLLREGSDVTLFGSGIMVKESLEAADILAGEGIDAEVIGIHTIKPINAEQIVASVMKTGAAVTAENHNILGGMGSAVAEAIVQNCPVPVEMIGFKNRCGQVGPMDFLKEDYGMTAQDIACAAMKAISRKKK